MVTARLYVEGGGRRGGGRREALQSECRRGFREFLEKAGLKGRMPRIVACGGREQAYEDYRTALSTARSDEIILLLIDSEGPVTAASPWEHLGNAPGNHWLRPTGASDDHCHLMVQCMETWLVADLKCLQKFFGDGFNENALRNSPDIEAIPPKDLVTSLSEATRHARTKGPYDKAQHSFKLLAAVDPTEVSQASPWARRFLETMDRLCR